MKSMMKSALNLRGLTLVLFAFCLSLAGCTPPPDITSKPDPKGGIGVKEAPVLASLVQSGKLPALASRLPLDPLVIKPVERPGEYGGVWHLMVDNPDLSVYKMIGGYAPLVRWRSDCLGLEPGTAKSWEYNAEGNQLTLHLRHGLKWSDGVEYTSADFAYWAKLTLEKKQLKTRPFWSLVKGQDMVVETPDKYTLVLKFAGANWYVAQHLATGYWNSDDYNMPKHYLEQFDPLVNPKYKDYSIFDKKNSFQLNPDRPTLTPWKLSKIEEGGYKITLDRNPYYYMTDTLGRQLPYIDQIIAAYTPDAQVRVLKILSGAVDAQFRLVDLRDYSLYKAGEKSGGYRVLRWKEANGSDPSLMLNWDVEDPSTRELIRDLRFRQALSLAVDRDKCNQVAWRGLGVPKQGTVSRESWHFQSAEGKKVFNTWAKSYAEFDLKHANALLDDMGMTKRDSENFRLRKDGQRLSILFDIPPAGISSAQTDIALVVTEGWRQLGMEVILKNWPSAEYTLRQKLAKYTVSLQAQAEMDLFTYPDWVFPTSDNYWHSKVGKWYKTGGKEGEAPTGIMKELLAIYAKIIDEKDIEKAHKLVQEAVKLHTEKGLFSIGTVGELPQIVIAKSNFRNVPSKPQIMGPWAPAGPATSYPETFFYSSRPEDNPTLQTAQSANQTARAAGGHRP
ncbi:MAG: ABC transporter substrate-binding protein [Chthonomonadaceae bacterium]|nr:ABC transporter substrate-binding protein [Chthonomonadaceae bacterium]